jgi:beta-lactamase regulating signal transducer with metallopeptidase domain
VSATWFAGDPRVSQLGWTLLQFLWQGTILALLFAGVRAMFERRLSARTRYAMACATLALMAAAPVVTFLTASGVSLASGRRWLLPAASAWEPVMPWLVVAWLGGVWLFSVRLVGGWVVTRRLRTEQVESPPPEWQRVFDELVVRLGVLSRVRLLVSSLVEVPTVTGALHPFVLVPASALTGLPPEYIRAFLAHELAHVRRFDYAVNLLQRVVEAVLFYHPAIWWVSEQIRVEREMCCDDIAVAAHGDAVAYARALTALESSRRAPAAAVAANGPTLLHRIRRLLGQAITARQLLPGPGAFVAIALVWAVGIVAVGARDGSASTALASATLVSPPIVPSQGNVGHVEPAGPSLLTTALLGPIGPARSAQTPAPSTSGRPGPPPADQTRDGDRTPATGVVRGRVVRQDNGLPVRNAKVHLSQLFSGNPPAAVADPPPVTTDENGRFELTGIRPGEYQLAVSKSGFVRTEFGRRGVNGPAGRIDVSNGRVVEKIDVSLPTGGIITGQVLDQAGDPLSGILVRALEAERVNGALRPGDETQTVDVTDDRGRFRLFGLAPGAYFLGATRQLSGIAQMAVGNGGLIGMALYPGTFLASQAESLVIEADKVLPPVSLTFVREMRVRVSGRVSGSDGSPVASGAASIRPDGTYRGYRAIDAPISGGTFLVTGLPPGEYVVAARNAAGDERVDERLVLDGSPADIALTLQHAASLRGRIVLDTASPRPSIRPSDISLGLGDAAGPPAFGGVEIRDDGTFEVKGLLGRKSFGYAPPEGWRLKSVRIGNRDKGDEPLEFNGQDIEGVQLIFTDRITVLNGRVTDGRRPVPAGVVLMFADDPEKWYPQSGYVDTASLDAEGRYTIEGLPPGRYRVIALDSLGPLGPSVFESFRSRAVTVTLGEAERKTLDLKLSFP